MIWYLAAVVFQFMCLEYKHIKNLKLLQYILFSIKINQDQNQDHGYVDRPSHETSQIKRSKTTQRFKYIKFSIGIINENNRIPHPTPVLLY